MMNHTRTKRRRLTGISVVIIIMISSSVFLISCNKNNDEIKCEGCDKDTPWSNSTSSYCYPSEDACVADTGGECEKCR